MSHDRSIPRDPASYGIEANVGIDLRQADDGEQLIAIPRAHPEAHDQPPKPFYLIPIPSPLLEEKARVLRRLAYAGRRGIWVLYVDTASPHAWHAYFPWQWASPSGVRVDLTYPLIQVPGPQLRLAGTFQSAPLAKPDDLVPLLSPIDGVHLVMHPAEGWLLMTTFLIIGGQPYPVLPHRLILDPLDQQMPSYWDMLKVDEPGR